ncbi:hypothetical protein F5148DRAFT_1151110 [Russula earlei]|uniref:Uncharacterized protein n=1 Tax=Russula earlei TaxID=71964 RepID=A0ACC0U1K5_9AGAM|nr:hypothetical protein F5148DRAFT_1151110 [Russula earlei]
MPPTVRHLPSLALVHNTPPFPWLIEFFHPRRSRLRATLLCLVSLLILTTYVCLISSPVLSPGHLLNPYSSKHHNLADTWRKLAAKVPAPPATQWRPDVSLTPEQELGALTAFMVALPQNVIPTDIDPDQPIDPQLVLDFDTRVPEAEEEIADIVLDVWIKNPVVVFSKLRSAVSRELKSILQTMDLKPPPTIFDVDERVDADVLTPLLFRLTNSTELPILLIGGTAVGSIDRIRELNADGKLKEWVIGAGAVPGSTKKPRKGHR